jgi:hypothetical protein
MLFPQAESRRGDGSLSASHNVEYRRGAGSRCRERAAQARFPGRDPGSSGIRRRSPRRVGTRHRVDRRGTRSDNVYAWAKEQAGEVSHEMFGEWMHRNELSLTTAAEALGISRRMLSYYRTAHKAIPRSIVTSQKPWVRPLSDSGMLACRWCWTQRAQRGSIRRHEHGDP